MDTRVFFRRIEELLLPIYGKRVPLAATYLDDRIKAGFIAYGESDDPAAPVTAMPVTEFAEKVTSHDGTGHPKVCPQLNCAGQRHVSAEHRIWVHLHHMHAAGRLLMNDNDVLRLTIPPQAVGGQWRFVSSGRGLGHTHS